MKIAAIIAGLGMTLVSLISILVFLIAIIDPVGTKMADDNDPFGSPPSRIYSGVGLLASALIGMTGVWLVNNSFKKQKSVA